MFLAFALVFVSWNLRPAVSSVSPVLAEIRGDLGLSGAEAGLLTTLPVLCFGIFGSMAPALARRIGSHRLVGCVLAAIVCGVVLRVLIPVDALFLLITGLVLSAIAVGNVLLPALVKLHFPRRVGVMTGLYTMGLASGTAIPAAVTIPTQRTLGGDWHTGLLVWAAFAGMALLLWLPCLRLGGGLGFRRPAWLRLEGGLGLRRSIPVGPAGDLGGRRTVSNPSRVIPTSSLVRSPLAWALAAYVGAQSLQAYAMIGWLPEIYRSAGFSAQTGGVLLALVTGLGMPVAMTLPAIAAKREDQRVFAVILACSYAAGYIGLTLGPAAAPWLWALLIGLGGGSFPLGMTLVGLRTRTPAGAAALSGFVQSVGYLLAALGPLVVGVLYDLTANWDVSLIFLMITLFGLLFSGLLSGRPRYLEDELRSSPAGVASR